MINRIGHEFRGKKKISIVPIKDGWKCFLDIARRKNEDLRFQLTRKFKMIDTAALENN